MTDWLHKLFKAIDYNRFLAAGVVASLALVVFLAAGCESLTPSLVTPTTKVSRVVYLQEAVQLKSGLETEKAEVQVAVGIVNGKIQALNEMVDIGLADLQRQDEVKAKLLEFAGITTDQLLPASAKGFLAPLLGLFGIVYGASKAADKRRTDKVLDDRKKAEANGGK